jgi:hypothetical protein
MEMTASRDDHIDIDRNARGEAFVRCLCELERVLRSFGPDRRIATLIASQVLLDGLNDG